MEKNISFAKIQPFHKLDALIFSKDQKLTNIRPSKKLTNQQVEGQGVKIYDKTSGGIGLMCTVDIKVLITSRWSLLREKFPPPIISPDGCAGVGFYACLFFVVEILSNVFLYIMYVIMYIYI